MLEILFKHFFFYGMSFLAYLCEFYGFPRGFVHEVAIAHTGDRTLIKRHYVLCESASFVGEYVLDLSWNK